MLNIALKSTYEDKTGFMWEYYQDDTDANTYYVLPRPQFVLDEKGRPSFQIVTFTTDNPATNGSGYCRFDVELTVPPDVQQAVAQQIQQRAPSANPIFKALDEQPGGKASVLLSNMTKTITAVAPVSGFGSDVSSFVLHLTKDQLATLQAVFTTSGGAAELEYRLHVPARLPAVKAKMSFDSTVAYSYQVTQPTYDDWGEETSAGSVQKLLNESASSKVELTWGVSNPPQELEQAVADWANGMLADHVQAEVQETIRLQGLTSNDSFNINEVNSFTSEYDANEAIDWILVPSYTLPSFPEMGQDIAAFTASVNEQQQIMQVTTQLLFAEDGEGESHGVEPVESLTVTVSYPGLPEAEATHIFTKNGSQVFTAAFDAQHGPVWDLSYTATYAGSTAPVHGKITGIEQGAYTLTLPDVGILSVTFDASNVFGDTSHPVPDEIHVNLTYPNFDMHGNPYTKQLTLTKTQTAGVIAERRRAAYRRRLQLAGDVRLPGHDRERSAQPERDGHDAHDSTPCRRARDEAVHRAARQLGHGRAGGRRGRLLRRAATGHPRSPGHLPLQAVAGGVHADAEYPQAGQQTSELRERHLLWPHQRQPATRVLGDDHARERQPDRHQRPACGERPSEHQPDPHPALLHRRGHAGRDRLEVGAVQVGERAGDSVGYHTRAGPTDVDLERRRARTAVRHLAAAGKGNPDLYLVCHLLHPC